MKGILYRHREADQREIAMPHALQCHCQLRWQLSTQRCQSPSTNKVPFSSLPCSTSLAKLVENCETGNKR